MYMNARVDPFAPETVSRIPPRAPDGSLAAALARAQGAFKPINRDKTVTVRTKAGGTYSFSYAPLEAILRAVQPALTKEGLALSQSIVTQDGAEYLETTLKLGDESLSNRVKVLVVEGGPQAYGSALTYARRYGVTLLLCVCADDDDDGNAAEGNEAHPAYPPDVLTPEKRTALLPKVAAAIDSKNVADLKKLVDAMNEGEQKGVWSFLSTKQKAAARELMQKAPPKVSKAQEYAERLREALDVGIDQRISEIHAEINLVPEFALEVSTILTPGETERVNAAVDRMR